jgi:hypothetical protein
MRAARFLVLLILAAGLALIPTAGLFVGISAANQLSREGLDAVVFLALFVPCFVLLVCVFLRQQTRLEN